MVLKFQFSNIRNFSEMSSLEVRDIRLNYGKLELRYYRLKRTFNGKYYNFPKKERGSSEILKNN